MINWFSTLIKKPSPPVISRIKEVPVGKSKVTILFKDNYMLVKQFTGHIDLDSLFINYFDDDKNSCLIIDSKSKSSKYLKLIQNSNFVEKYENILVSNSEIKDITILHESHCVLVDFNTRHIINDPS